jgi:hypothetical protein
VSDPRLLAALADPACFPHAPRAVQLVQTHLSLVCLADQLVYKLKKTITLPFVDFAPLRRTAPRLPRGSAAQSPLVPRRLPRHRGAAPGRRHERPCASPRSGTTTAPTTSTSRW